MPFHKRGMPRGEEKCIHSETPQAETSEKKPTFSATVQMLDGKKVQLLRARQCSSQGCLQQPGRGSNLDVHRQTNG